MDVRLHLDDRTLLDVEVKKKDHGYLFPNLEGSTDSVSRHASDPSIIAVMKV